jgi:hypothetical protein
MVKAQIGGVGGNVFKETHISIFNEAKHSWKRKQRELGTK